MFMALGDPRILDRTLTTVERVVLDRFVMMLRRHYEGRLAKLLVLGSRARGDASEDSDIDLLVVLEVAVDEEASEVDAVWRLLAEAKGGEVAYVPISPLVMSAARFEELRRAERRLTLDAAAEGIAL